MVLAWKIHGWKIVEKSEKPQRIASLGTTPIKLVHARALALFLGVLSDDVKTRHRILELQSSGDEPLRLPPSGEEDELLVFSLLALYQLLELETELVFSVFRRALYQGNMNEELAAQGGRILVHESAGRIDENLYVLSRL